MDCVVTVRRRSGVSDESVLFCLFQVSVFLRWAMGDNREASRDSCRSCRRDTFLWRNSAKFGSNGHSQSPYPIGYKCQLV